MVGGRPFWDAFKMGGKIVNGVLGLQIYLKIITRDSTVLVLKEAREALELINNK